MTQMPTASDFLQCCMWPSLLQWTCTPNITHGGFQGSHQCVFFNSMTIRFACCATSWKIVLHKNLGHFACWMSAGSRFGDLWRCRSVLRKGIHTSDGEHCVKVTPKACFKSCPCANIYKKMFKISTTAEPTLHNCALFAPPKLCNTTTLTLTNNRNAMKMPKQSNKAHCSSNTKRNRQKSIHFCFAHPKL